MGAGPAPGTWGVATEPDSQLQRWSETGRVGKTGPGSARTARLHCPRGAHGFFLSVASEKTDEKS